MNEPSGNYTFSQCILNDGLISLYHAFNNQEQTPCLIKAPADESAADSCSAYLQHEFDICAQLQCTAGIIKSNRLIKSTTGYLAEFHHCDVIPLSMALKGESDTTASPAFIDNAVTMIRLVESLHKSDLLHCNLSPNMFLKSISTGELFLTGFYVASRTIEHTPLQKHLHYYPPNCAYIAPEQTGNINRATDERTDYYTLGVIFYELLCGNPPFTDKNPASLLYSHVARKPHPVHLLNENIPKSVSDIITKLLEKNPADRYQGTEGIIEDIEECRYHFEKPLHEQTSFTPGLKDRNTRLLPLNSMYGREDELKQLKDHFTDAAKGTSRSIVITGNAGIGKSCLVDSFIGSQKKASMLFAQGKCEASSINAPYHALKSALSDLVKNIIAQGSHAVAVWRDTFSSALGNHRNIIADFIPEIQMIIGPCHSPTHSDEAESGTLFKSTLLTFLRSIVKNDILFVLFIDDIQWADSAMIDVIIPAFFENNNLPMLFIGTGRPDDASYSIIDRLQNTPTGCTQIKLDNLDITNTSQILSNVLGTSPANISSLSETIHEKTGGNPFFLLQFIETLLQKKIIHPPTQSDTKPVIPAAQSNTGWTWDVRTLTELCCTENVIELILDKLDTLPNDTLHLLQTAACIGMKSDCTILSKIIDTPLSQVIAHSTIACTAGFIRLEDRKLNTKKTPILHFIHDRIREAIYSKISVETRKSLHLHIGRSLQKLFEDGTSTLSVYDITKHLNPFADNILNMSERLVLAGVNRLAALTARNSHAYNIALSHCEAADVFLKGHTEQKSSDLVFSIEFLHAECEYLVTSFDKALERLRYLEQKDLTAVQRAQIDLLRMSIFDHTQKTARSLETGAIRLRAMGFPFPAHPSIPHAVVSFVKAAATIRSITKIPPRDASISQPEEMQIITRILCRMWLNAFILQRQDIIIIIMSQMIALTRKYGECGATSVALCFWGIFRAMLFSNPVKGLLYGNRALSIAQRLDDTFSRGITLFLYGSFFAYLDGHIDNSLDILSLGIKTSYDAGDFVSASNSSEGHLLFTVASGKNVDEILAAATSSLQFLSKINLGESESVFPACILQWAENIKGSLTFHPDNILSCADSQVPLMQGVIFFLEMITAVMIHKYDTALLFAAKLKKSPLITPNSYFHFYLVFFKALAISGSLPDNSSKKPPHRLTTCAKFLKKASIISPVNFEHIYLFVKAEICRHNNQKWDALQLYHKAIHNAETHGFILYAALAAERASLFTAPYNIFQSRQFVTKSVALFSIWGCSSKAENLRKNLPDLLLPSPSHLPLHTGSSDIDLQALLNAFEAISHELRLDRLPEKLIHIIMQHTGAQRGVLLLDKDGTLKVQAEGILEYSQKEPESTSVIQTRSINIPSELYPVPQSILSFVTLSREHVHLSNACRKGRFVHDSYFHTQHIKSVLALPLLYSDRLRGIIYLENNMIEDAFPLTRLPLLRMLSTQAIISLESALFHEVEIKHLQAKVNPHFIFNALSSIAELCHSDPNATEDAIIKLSTLYRYVLSAEMKLVTVDEELNIVKKYLAIEKLRFGPRLIFDIQTEGPVSPILIPSMIIQPLVENSIKHGITPRPSGGKIFIFVTSSATICTIVVEDDGVGPGHGTSGTGYGLESIRKRLLLHYGEKASIEINDAAGYRVTVRFPFSDRST